MTTPHTSGAADLPDAMHMAELLENPINVVCQKTAAAVLRHQHSELERLHALAAGQATAPQQEVPDECFPGEPKVAVPQGLIGAACFAIRNNRNGSKVLEQLRRYSVGDQSQPLAPQPSPTPQAADNVQEEAARYRLLRRCKGQEHEPPFTVQHEIDGTLWGGDLDAAIDAARKQEASNDL